MNVNLEVKTFCITVGVNLKKVKLLMCDIGELFRLLHGRSCLKRKALIPLLLAKKTDKKCISCRLINFMIQKRSKRGRIFRWILLVLLKAVIGFLVISPASRGEGTIFGDVTINAESVVINVGE